MGHHTLCVRMIIVCGQGGTDQRLRARQVSVWGPRSRSEALCRLMASCRGEEPALLYKARCTAGVRGLARL